MAGRGRRPASSKEQQSEAKKSKTDDLQTVIEPSTAEQVNIVTPIGELKHCDPKTTIVARVTGKQPLRVYQNEKGSGHVVNMDLQDSSGSIRVVAFGIAAQTLSTKADVGKTYRLTNFSLRKSNKQFSSNTHDFELYFGVETELAEGDCDLIPQFNPAYTSIGSLTTQMVGQHVNVMGVLLSVSDKLEGTVQSTGKLFSKRDLRLFDMSSSEINLTLWGAFADLDNLIVGKTLSFIRVKVSSFGGLSLSSSFDTTVIEPTCPLSAALRNYFASRQV